MQTINFVRALTLGWLPLILAGLASSGRADAQDAWNFPDFSANQIFQSRRSEMKMKVYRSGASVRVERGGALTTLYAPASGMVYNLTVYPDQSRQCVAMKPEQAKMLPSPLELIQGRIVKRNTVGSESVDGHPSKIETVAVMGADGRTIESKVWEAEDLNGVPVKIESHIEGVTLLAFYRDIVVGAPDQGLFHVPDRCIPFEKMGQVAQALVVK
jgi:hypothetical protein